VEPTPRLANQIKEAKSILDQAITDVDLYAHEYHTCYNEGANGHRTQFLPKHRAFPSTAEARAAGAVIRFNEGVQYQKGLILQELGLTPSKLQKRSWEKHDARRETDRKRRQSDVYRQQTKDNYARKAKRRKHEKEVSKKRGDEYRAAHKASEPQQKKA
jgi:hypothetical protein